ncbi:hypothetical protein GCM10014715_71860 [Streptomyces spiralis]|uniref:Uncharacterized protein n=1 Tax=Streptomyces spiralis TaxID=66376 RepID=A0A919AIE0_9ACTN|nr:hypothetical protein GCM10014715_71860 [Streptomyces spiralis]
MQLHCPVRLSGRAGAAPAGGSTRDPTPLPNLRQGRSHMWHPTPVERTKKIALDPAESSAIYDAPVALPEEL